MVPRVTGVPSPQLMFALYSVTFSAPLGSLNVATG
jgi:hypothetical protein